MQHLPATSAPSSIALANVALSGINDTKKIRLFNEALAACTVSNTCDSDMAVVAANIAVTQAINNNSSLPIVELSTVYNMIASDLATRKEDMFIDSTTNRDILNSKHHFKNLHPIEPIHI
ncbi:hypothetical protein CROQUDRAFT_44043 [Cronartium quercuum f. sp. fusiforme G11]|uniref:Uncharacterized protein n=1 Tax=Cronartium quercuum f. sp. fusiforme G11 TaxID=708437 RepID=A0A9P6NNH6_9BASI|nr:hypothetical protein CROQUDRAFT_44043 [Cronartium quercuum f. sp. fusiforme G11]